PDMKKLVKCGCIKDIAASYSVTSRNCPRPEATRSTTASSMPFTQYRPVEISTTGSPSRVGPDSSDPVTLQWPTIASTTPSYPGKPPRGPSAPKTDILQ